MKVFLTGGTGFVGRELVRKLYRAGHDIHLLVRNPSSVISQELADKYSAKLLAGDILNRGSLESGIEGAEAIINLVGIISESGPINFENLHKRAAENLVTAAQKAGIQRFLQMSALGTRPNAISRYHQTKWAAEQIVRGSRLEFTIFRPSLIYGPDDHFVNLFARIIRLSPVVPVLGKRDAKFEPVAVGIVATAFAEALLNRQAMGQTYHLCGPEVFTLREIVEAIADVMGKKRWFVHLPQWFAHLQAFLLEGLFSGLLGKPPPLNRDQLLMLSEDNVGNGEPANELFGLRPMPFREGIATYLHR